MSDSCCGLHSKEYKTGPMHMYLKHTYTYNNLYKKWEKCDTISMAHKGKWTKWFLGEEYTKGLASYMFPSVPGLFCSVFNWRLKNLLIPSVWEAPVNDGPLPVVVFSHGLSANRGFYGTICTELASHGFFVAAIEHRDLSACATFTLSENGKKEFHYFKKLPRHVKEYSLRNEQLKIRVQESIHALDNLEKLNAGLISNDYPSGMDLGQFIGALDLSHPVMAGHSFGGATCISVLATEKRFRVGVALDPWMFPVKDEFDTFAHDVIQPLICISTEHFQTEANLKLLKLLENKNTTFVTVRGTVHQNQCDTPFILGTFEKWFAGAHSPLDPKIASEINNSLMLAFLCKNLGISGDFLDRISSFISTLKSVILPGIVLNKKSHLVSSL